MEGNGVHVPGRRSMTAVVLGGSGFLGSHLCDALLARGQDVIAVDDLSTGRLKNIEHLTGNKSFKFVQADISLELPDLGTPELILNFASPASPPAYLSMPIHTMRTGSLGTMHALELASKTNARFVMASTSEIYGDPLEHPQTESYWGNANPVGVRSCYDEAKRFAESLTFAYQREQGTNTGIVRIFNTYGPRLDPKDGRVVSNFIMAALHNQPLNIYGDGSQTRSLCYVSDLVDGILRMADSKISGPINLGNPNEMTVLQLAQRIIELTRSQSTINFQSSLPDDPQQRNPDITLAKSKLDWFPHTDLDTGLQSTIHWMSTMEKKQ
jgi:nucleoside-diphosphate-sugar epimerase